MITGWRSLRAECKERDYCNRNEDCTGSARTMKIHYYAKLAALLLGLALSMPALAEQARRWTVKEWVLPTRDSHPHDPAVAPDGSLWYTAQQVNKLGRVDPATGAIKEFPLPTPDSGPHGLVVDRNGNVWYTANSKGLIGKLDPRSGRVTEYPIKDSRGRDPHTPVLDQQNIVWFTVEEGNTIGRLDPKSGDITLTDVPTPHAAPYGIVVSSRGTPFFCEFGSNKLADINPETLKVTEHPLPNADARPRRLALAADDSLYFSDYARGYLGHFDPKTGKVNEWPSPGGKDSHPYAIAVTKNGVVWYSESGVKPNTIVRFDPKTEEFAVEAVPSGGGTIRNMVATPTGRIYIAESGVNTVGMIEPAR